MIAWTSCSIPFINLTSISVLLYFGDLVNVRVVATNEIGNSEPSLPVFHDHVSDLIEFGGIGPWNNFYSLDETKDVKIT